MNCQCEGNDSDDASTGLWLGSNKVQMGTFAVVGYFLYRFSQTLPALIRWPIRLFCSLTGLSALWSWVSRLVGTVRVIKTLFKWISRLWRFIIGSVSKLKLLNTIIRAITGSSKDGAIESEKDWTMNIPNKPGFKLILLGPAGEGRTSLSQILLGQTETRSPKGSQMESTRRRRVIDGGEITVIDTPDLLGSSLGNSKRAMEALRSLQLASPGPHAFLLVIQAPGSSMGIHQDAAQAIRATLEVFGDNAIGYIIPVLTHADRLGRRRTLNQLLDVDTGGLKAALSLCDQKPELVDLRPDASPEEQRMIQMKLMDRVIEMKTLRGYFVHELQRREDQIREQLLAEVAAGLARKLGRM